MGQAQSSLQVQSTFLVLQSQVAKERERGGIEDREKNNTKLDALCSSVKSILSAIRFITVMIFVVYLEACFTPVFLQSVAPEGHTQL